MENSIDSRDYPLIADEELTPAQAKAKKKAIWAWTMYDWGNSAFATTIMAAILPVYFADYIMLGESAVPIWGWAVAIGSLIAALISPVLGAIADFRGSKKAIMVVFVALGVLSTAAMFFLTGSQHTMLTVILYILGTIGFAGSLVFYDALLPHIAREDELDIVSSKGYAMGYIGGGLLLLINVLMIFFGPKLLPNMAEAEATQLMMRLSMASVAIWWAIFSIPLFKHVLEPPAKAYEHEIGQSVVKVGFSRFFAAFKNVRKFRDLAWFMLTFFIYSNGIGTIITMAVIIGAARGFSTMTLIGTLLLVQFVAAPFAILFGKLADKLGQKRTISLSLVIYLLIAIIGFFMSKEWHFYALGFAVATVQGGSQALSRSLVGKLMPASKSAEFYGFFSVFEKFNTVVGPLLLAIITKLTGSDRYGMISLILFFIVGIIMLQKVDIPRGMAVAEAEDALLVEVD
jgi:UMF1 family MFS transporter